MSSRNVMANFFARFGNYPAEYNRKVHGPFYPWVNYGPKEEPLADVKIGELSQWWTRRNKKPYAAIACASRKYHYWHYLYFDAKYGSPTKGILQTAVFACFISMLGLLRHLRHERSHKYHW